MSLGMIPLFVCSSPPEATSIADLNPDFLVIPGDYNGSPPGTWTELNDNDLIGIDDDGPMVDIGGYPTFEGGVDVRLGTYTWTLADWAGSGDHHLYCVFEPTTITSTNTSNVFFNESPFDNDGGYIGFYLRVTAGVYYCDFYEYDTAERIATVELGDTLRKFIIQCKKQNGSLWIKLDYGNWIEGDACGATGNLTYGLMIGGSNYGAVNYSGKVYSVASWKRVLTDFESHLLVRFGTRMGFYPTYYADNVAWFDGRAGVTTSEGFLESWANQSTNAPINSDLIPFTGSPAWTTADLFFNEEDSVIFNGNALDTGIWGRLIPQPFRTYFVIRTAADGGGFCVMDDIDGTEQVTFYSGDGYISAGSNELALTTPVSETIIICIIYNGASSEVYMTDPTAAESLGAGTPGTSRLRSIRLGSRYNYGDFYKGRLAAFGVFSGIGSETERVGMFSELSSRYITPPIPAPIITSLNHTVGDIDGGGQLILVNGSYFITGCTCTLGTVTFISQSQLSIVLPDHAGGVVDVIVTNPDTQVSTGGTGAFEYWGPASITGVSAYLDANKSVTGGGAVSAITDQISSNAFEQATAGAKPAQTASVFGDLPSIRHTPQDFLKLAANVELASGMSVFWVTKHTSADTSAAGNNAPLTLVSNGNVSPAPRWGFSAGTLRCAYSLYEYDDIGETWSWVEYTQSYGSGLNDGTARLTGWTHASGGTLKAYSGTTQQGTMSVTYTTGYTHYGSVGAGESDIDGFDGDWGAIVIVSGVISAGDHTKLHKWSQQRFGTE